MTLPSFPSVAGASRPSLGGSLVIDKPTGVVENDWMICYISCSANTVITDASGLWTLDGTAAGLRAFRKKAGASEAASYTFTRASDIGNTIGGQIVRVIDAHPTTPVDLLAMQAGGSGTTVVLPSLTVVSGVTLLQIAEHLVNTSYTPQAGPPTPTELFDAQYGTAAFTGAVGIETVGAGATGTRTWTAANSGTRSGVMYALRGADQTVSPSGLAVPVTFGTPTVTLEQVLSPSGFAVPVTFGTPTVTPGDVTVSPAGIAIPVTFGTPTVTPGDVTVSPSGFAVPVTFGAPTVTPGEVTVSPTGIAVPVTFGTPTVTTSTTIEPSGFAVPVTFGTPVITTETTISPSGFAVPVTFGTPVLIFDQIISPTGIAVPITFGTPLVFIEVDAPVDGRANIRESGVEADITSSNAKAVLT